MDRAEIVRQYTDEIMELVKLRIATPETVAAALQCVLTEWHITIIKQQTEVLNEALSSLERGRE